eukprot:Awhi_evm1s5528
MFGKSSKSHVKSPKVTPKASSKAPSPQPKKQKGPTTVYIEKKGWNDEMGHFGGYAPKTEYDSTKQVVNTNIPKRKKSSEQCTNKAYHKL